MRWDLALITMIAIDMLLGACSLETDPPPRRIPRAERDGDGTEGGAASAAQLIERPILDPTESEGRICTDHGAVVGRAQPGATVVARGPAGPATAEARDTDGRFCVAVPLVKGRQNRIQVFSQHPTHGTSEAAATTLTHAGLDCPEQRASPEPDPPSEDAQTLSIIQVQTSKRADQGADRAMIDRDESTFAYYSVFNWTLWEERSDEMWIWLTLAKVETIKEIHIQWTDSLGRGTRYAQKFYVAVSAAESPGTPTLPPVGNLITGDVPPPSTDWTYVVRPAQLNARGGRQEVDLSDNLPVAQHIALWLEADANWLSLSEEFSIAEIEVIRAPVQGSSFYQPGGSPGVCSGVM